MEVTRKRGYLIILYEYCLYKIGSTIKFYCCYIPKFLNYLIEHREYLWKNFMKDYIDSLKIEVYALRNKKLNERYGDFEKDHPLYGGVTKAMEITSSMESKILNDPNDPDRFKKMVNERTKQFSHHTIPSKEEKLEELRQEYKGKGLGEIVGFCEEEDGD